MRAVPTLHALGPLRGDNFARFALHDGHAVADSVRAASERKLRKLESVPETSAEADPGPTVRVVHARWENVGGDGATPEAEACDPLTPEAVAGA